MATAPSPSVSTHHPGELDELFSDLLKGGFAPIGGDPHRWRGPINPALGTLTPDDTMVIEVRDGWPYLHPYVHVSGLVGRRHVNSSGNVCLWEEDEGDWWAWLRLPDIQARIDEWVADQVSGAGIPPLDAHLYFNPSVHDQIVVIDIDHLIETGAVRPAPGWQGVLRATASPRVYRVGTTGPLTAACFWIDRPHAPPASPNSLRALVSSEQWVRIEALGSRVRKKRPILAIVLWAESEGVGNGLALRVSQRVGIRTAVAIPIARSDQSMLRLRSGPDAPALSEKSVAIFGVGAIGSEVALLLARSGIGSLDLIDGDVLRPANLSRHAATGREIGLPKPDAIAKVIGEALPYVKVKAIAKYLWRTSELEPLVAGNDLIVDATGNQAYRDLLSRLAAASGTPMVAAALHRKGSISRVSIQLGSSAPIWGRGPASGFPTIQRDPAGPGVLSLETGCGSPVNNAPPTSAMAAAVAASKAAIDVLVGRERRNVDIVEVDVPIEQPPFDTPGRLTFEPVP